MVNLVDKSNMGFLVVVEIVIYSVFFISEVVLCFKISWFSIDICILVRIRDSGIEVSTYILNDVSKHKILKLLTLMQCLCSLH
jgi:hypothetical protein